MSILLTETWDTVYPIFIAGKPTEQTDKSFWKNHVYPYFKDYQLQEINTNTVLSFKSALEHKKLSPQTVKHCLALLRRIYSKATLLNIYSGAVPIFIMPKFDNQRIRYLMPSEVHDLLLTLKNLSEQWWAISTFALHTGLRASEIFNLRGFNINTTIKAAYIMDTKSYKNRAVPLNKTAYSIATSYYTKPNNILFPTKNGTPYTDASNIFYKALDYTGINAGITDRRQKIVFHSLRHTFATRLVQKGVNIETISKLLGHRNIQMTLRYAHFAAVEQHAAVNLLDQAI